MFLADARAEKDVKVMDSVYVCASTKNGVLFPTANATDRGVVIWHCLAWLGRRKKTRLLYTLELGFSLGGGGAGIGGCLVRGTTLCKKVISLQVFRKVDWHGIDPGFSLPKVFSHSSHHSGAGILT